MEELKATYDSRLEDISALLINYSMGNFSAQLPMSEVGDDIDAIIAGVNMLGEELQHVTISRDFLSSVYNSIAEMLFVLDLQGNIQETNNIAVLKIKKPRSKFVGNNIFNILSINTDSKFLHDFSFISSETEKTEIIGELLEYPEVKLKCTFTILKNSLLEPTGILLIAEDVSHKIATEKLIIRTIVDTQEKERNRFAIDLHDSLGQQLSGIRFYISALQTNVPDDERSKLQFSKAMTVIDNSIVELRQICFNLMPRTLENHTLHFSIEELASQLKIAGGLTIKFTYNNQVPALSKAFEIACFRIIQEFVNNAMKHGKASEVFLSIELDSKKQMLLVELADNGCGFDQNSPNFQFGMGLKNIRTRVESYYGKMLLESKIDLGTRIKLEFPISFLIL